MPTSSPRLIYFMEWESGISATIAVDKLFVRRPSDVGGQVEFDQIAPVYDETRRPPSLNEIQALTEILSGCRRLLDAGVGTGRFAVPLQAGPFEVIGVDLSLAMMRRAQVKGIRSLVRADIRRLPFIPNAVDAAFSTHVLQLIEHPREVLAELGRVARRFVVILLPEGTEHEHDQGWHALRKRYRELAAELGYPLPPRGKCYRHTLAELTAIAAPALVRPVKVAAATSSLSDSLARWEARTRPGMLLPPEIHAQIVRRLELECPSVSSRWGGGRDQRFIVWDAADLKEGA